MVIIISRDVKGQKVRGRLAYTRITEAVINIQYL